MEQTTKALVTLIETGNAVINAIQDDNRVDFKESMQISIKALGLIGIFKNIGKIKEELKNRTEEEMCLLVETFKAKFDLKTMMPNKKSNRESRFWLNWCGCYVPQKQHNYYLL
jgi:hypothetical protein